ncbi:MAG: histidine kinase N-terminal 7TM domain-containing protein, partial [Dehalococcoidales bacterium]|nr:histidine kinase N-terminal 7TM domain-containing protein [Dehalococcoidales bacterium]
VYSYFLILAGTLALIQRLFRSPRLYRSQSIALLAAVATPLVWNVLYISRLLPAYRIDLTPSAFAMSGLLIGWGLFRFRLFDIIPVARDSVIENMSEGVIVLDVQNRLIDINPAGQRIIGYPLSAVIGQPFASVLASYPEIVERSYVSATTIEAYAEVAIEKEGTRHHYELHASPLRDRRGRIIGRLIMLRDITERQEKEKQD